VEPISPPSSSPHQANRTVFCGFTLAIISAVSSRAAEPEPLSLMPGPAVTLSRWAPAITTLSSLVPGSSAITLTSVRVCDGGTRTCAVEPGWASATPLAKLAPTTGMVGSAGARVPTIRPSRSGVLPWLKMMTASAPAAWAFRALSAKVQVPRWISAMSLGPLKSSPAKSAASQPLVEARSPVRLMSTGITLPVTSPEPLLVKAPVSYTALTGVSCWSSAGNWNWNSNGSSVTS
jgi:hypothetical protein